MRARTLFPLGLALTLGTAVGCSKCTSTPAVSDASAPAPASASAPAPASASGSNATLTPPPRAPGGDPKKAALKGYYTDVCYYGSFGLRHVRDAYFGGLGGAEPTLAKLPSFGLVQAPAPAADAGAPTSNPRNLTLRGTIYSRFCAAAGHIADPPMGAADKALEAFVPVALELGDAVYAARLYYEHGDYKKDKLARGRELHQTLTAAFPRFDDLHGKLGKALVTYHREHPEDVTGRGPGGPIESAAYTDSRRLLDVASGRIVPAAWAVLLEKATRSIDAFDAYAEKTAGDPFSDYLRAPYAGLKKAASDLNVTEKGVDPEGFFGLVVAFGTVAETRPRSLSHAMKAELAAPDAGPPRK